MNEDTRLREGPEPRGDDGHSPPRGGERQELRHGGAPGAGHSPAAATGVYAALDLGTNNCRLLIACPTGDSFRVVDSFSRIIRLGEGISATGCISDAAIDRAIAALSICRDKIQSKRAKRLRLIATEACRAASNADGFMDRVAAETGIRLEVINRETEAALAVTGCSPLLDPNGRGAILFDIGGGSTELVRIERDPRSRMRSRASRRGCRSRSVWSRWPKLSAARTSRRNPMRTWSRRSHSTSRPFAAEHGADLAGMHLLGTSGTVTTLAGVHLDLPRYDRRRIDGVWMSDADLTATIARLRCMTYQERAGNNCISIERADLVLAGCAILDAIRGAFPLPRLRVADRGLREGMSVEMMRADGGPERMPIGAPAFDVLEPRLWQKIPPDGCGLPSRARAG